MLSVRVSLIMLEDCRCCMHRYLSTITSHPPDSTPAGDSDGSGDSDSTVAVSSRCPAAGPIPPWQRRAHNNLTTLLHYDLFSVSHPPATTLVYMCKGLSSVRSYGPSAIDHGPSDQHQDLTRVDSLIQYESFMPISSLLSSHPSHTLC